MFSFATNLVKAAASVALALPAAAVDIVTLPASASDPRGEAFGRTAKMLGNAGRCADAALTPSKG